MPTEEKSFIVPKEDREIPPLGNSAKIEDQLVHAENWYEQLKQTLRKEPYFLDLDKQEDRIRLTLLDDDEVKRPYSAGFRFSTDKMKLFQNACRGNLLVYPLGEELPRQIQGSVAENGTPQCEISGEWKGPNLQRPEKPKGMPFLKWLANTLTFGLAYKQERKEADAREAAYKEAKEKYDAMESLRAALEDHQEQRKWNIRRGDEIALRDKKIPEARRNQEAVQSIRTETANLKSKVTIIETVNDRLQNLEDYMRPGKKWEASIENELGKRQKVTLSATGRDLYRHTPEYKRRSELEEGNNRARAEKRGLENAKWKAKKLQTKTEKTLLERGITMEEQKLSTEDRLGKNWYADYYLKLNEDDLSLLGLLACGSTTRKTMVPGEKAGEFALRDEYAQLMEAIFNKNTDQAIGTNLQTLQKGKNYIVQAVNEATGSRTVEDPETEVFRAKYEANNHLVSEAKEKEQGDFEPLGKLLADGVKRTCDITLQGPGIKVQDIGQGKFLGQVVELLDRHPDIREKARDYGLSDELVQQARGAAVLANICEKGFQAQQTIASALNEGRSLNQQEALDLIAKAKALKQVQNDVQKSYDQRESDRRDYMENIQSEYEVRKRIGSDPETKSYHQKLQSEMKQKWNEVNCTLVSKPGDLQMELGQSGKEIDKTAEDMIQQYKSREDVKTLAERSVADIAVTTIKAVRCKAPEQSPQMPGKVSDAVQKSIDAEKVKAEENYRKLLAEAAKRQKKPTEAKPIEAKSTKPKPTGPVM